MRTVKKQKSWPVFLLTWGSEAPACCRQACGSRDTNHGLLSVCHGCARVAPPESAARTASPPSHCFPARCGAAMERHKRQIAPKPVSAAHLPPFMVASRRAPFAAAAVALPEFFEEHAESRELWSPEPAARNAVYQCPSLILAGPRRSGKTITDLLAARIGLGSWHSLPQEPSPSKPERLAGYGSGQSRCLWRKRKVSSPRMVCPPLKNWMWARSEMPNWA